MPEISHKVLAETLRNLEQEGLIMRVECEGPLPHAEYQIAPHGNSVQPLIEAVRQWGHRHISWQAEHAESQRSNCADGTPKG
jgi:DNA-binding HxlR family transcriptional regulator